MPKPARLEVPLVISMYKKLSHVCLKLGLDKYPALLQRAPGTGVEYLTSEILLKLIPGSILAPIHFSDLRERFYDYTTDINET